MGLHKGNEDRIREAVQAIMNNWPKNWWDVIQYQQLFTHIHRFLQKKVLLLIIKKK
jgi:hypothetical protein